MQTSLASPTIEGFRAAFRRPSLTLAEITWRWTVGAVAWILFSFSLIEFLDTLPVTSGDKALLGTRQPVLVGRAMSHILRGSLNRAVLTTLVAALALGLLWIVAASIGHAATVRALIDYFSADLASGSTEGSGLTPSRVFRSLAFLNVLRVAASSAAILAFAGTAILAGFASPGANPQPALAFILFLVFAVPICILWPVLNWFLSLACVFAIRDCTDASGAFSAAVAFARERMGSVFAVSAWTGLAHLVALSVAGTAVSLPLAFVQLVPPRLIIAAIIFVALAYCAIVDWLYIARLAGYICIAEMPEAVATPTISPTTPPSGQPARAPQTAVDRDEPILSDLPNLALET